MKLEEYNEILEKLGEEPIDLRPEIPVYVVMYVPAPDIGLQFFGVFETHEEAERCAKRAKLRDFEIEEDIFSCSVLT